MLSASWNKETIQYVSLKVRFSRCPENIGLPRESNLKTDS